MIGASGVLLFDALRGAEVVEWGPLLLGAAVAAVAGMFVIRGLLRFVRQRSLSVFVWYRLALGAAVLAGVWAGAF